MAVLPPHGASQYTFMAHPVVDELVDITPLDPNTPREGLVFLKHLGKEEDFSAMKMTCSVVLYPPATFDEWRENQAAALGEATS